MDRKEKIEKYESLKDKMYKDMKELKKQRIYTKIGDIFVVYLEDGMVRYFQYVARDILQLNSDVIRVFVTKYDKDATPTIDEILNDDEDFVAHTSVNAGIKMACWEKVGNSSVIKEVHTIFRSSNDIGKKDILKSEYEWWIWKLYDDTKTNIGMLKDGKGFNSEPGSVYSPLCIKYRINYNEYVSDSW